MATSTGGSAITREVRDDKIAVLTFDTPGMAVNTFNSSNLASLEAQVDWLEKQSDIRGMVFRSGKQGQFIAGADLNEMITAIAKDKSQGRAIIERGHKLFTRITRLPFPTVAAIDGMCVGGGLECVMSMDYRIASNSPRTELGAPEIKIGIIPGWGGTQRLPRLVGIDQALEINCGGENIKAEKAMDIGLVFEVVPAEELLDEAVRIINMANEQGTWKKERERREQPMGLSDDNMLFDFEVFRGFLLGQTKGQYPAPIVAMESMRDGCNVPLQDGLKIEIDKVVPLIGSPINRSLVAIFFMDQAVRKDTGVENAAVKPRTIGRTGVLGGGLMGAGIAFAHVRRGMSTAMWDMNDELVDAGIKRVREPMEGRVKAGRMQQAEMLDSLGKLRTTTDKKFLAGCDIVIEAIVERKDIKIATFKELEDICGPDTILASNTSTISVTSMAEPLKRPDKFIGMHFFSPVDRMQLVEVIRGKKTSDETVATVVAQAKAIGKKPIVVNDCAGFLVNRALIPYVNEAVLMVEEGTDMQQIDKVATKFGMPMGPIALADMVGLDIAYHAGGVLVEAYRDRAEMTQLLIKLFEMKRLGQKTGAGFYAYDPKKKKKSGAPDGMVTKLVGEIGRKSNPSNDETILDRLFLTMLAEAIRIVEEGIVRKYEDVDFGMIFGIGFPPFRGGLLRWADSVGTAKLAEKLAKYEPLGKRYACPNLLKDLAKANKPFYAL